MSGRSTDVTANRAAWVAALRSGDYAQARGALRVDDGYCCLGVAEDVRGRRWLTHEEFSAEYDVDPDVFDDATHVSCDADGGDSATTTLSEGTRAWLGLLVDNPDVCYRGRDDGDEPYVVSSLVDLNDDERLTFAEIADVVADQPPDWTGGHDTAHADAEARNVALAAAEEAAEEADGPVATSEEE